MIYALMKDPFSEDSEANDNSDNGPFVSTGFLILVDLALYARVAGIWSTVAWERLWKYGETAVLERFYDCYTILASYVIMGLV